MDWIVAITALAHLYISPYTKVEESFNLQACHDIIFHGTDIHKYDHLEFSGVVPRTFIGPLIISSFAWPFVTIINFLGFSKFFSQYIIRFILGCFVFLSWRRLRIHIEKEFGSLLAFWFVLITASQFHFVYYMSRPLPNVFALIFAILSYVFWLEQRHGLLIYFSGVSILIFRSELCLLLGPMLLYDLSKRRLHIVIFLKHAIPAGLLCLSSSLIIDSIFWRQLVWPEGEVFWFNTYHNQSHQWGVYPFLWYWYSCIPRALALTVFLVPVGIAIDPRVRTLIAPAVLFVALYSFMPHKELRFIIYVFPFFNIAAARACQFFWITRSKSMTRKLLAIGSCFAIAGNFIFTIFLLTISSQNYPGGAAFRILHERVPASEFVNVHIDNLAAQTGVSRFGQLHSHWRYNKTEKLKAGGDELRSFTHLLVEAKSKYAYNLKHYTQSHEVIGSIDAFSHLHFNYLNYPPLKIRVKPSIFILKNLMENTTEQPYAASDEQLNMQEVSGNHFSQKSVNVDSGQTHNENVIKSVEEVSALDLSKLDKIDNINDDDDKYSDRVVSSQETSPENIGPNNQ